MEVLGAIASAVTLAHVSTKGLAVLLEIRELRKHFSELCSEIDFINDIVESVRQRHHGNDVAPQHNLDQVEATLREIADELVAIKERCQKDKLDANSNAKKWEWIRKSGKITELLSKAQNAKLNLNLALQTDSLRRVTAMERSIVLAPELSDRVAALEKLLADAPEFRSRVMGFMVSIDSKFENNAAREQGDERVQEVSNGNEIALHAKSVGLRSSHDEATLVHAPRPQLNSYTAFKSTYCSLACSCRCHTRSRQHMRNPNWTRFLVGKIDISYRVRTQGRSMSEMLCPCDDDILVQWRPPEIPGVQFWFSSSSSHSLRYTLRQKRLMSWRSGYWEASSVSLERTKLAMTRGAIFLPDDYHDTGESLIYVLMARGRFDLLDLLLREWASLLRKQGLPQDSVYLMHHMSGDMTDKRLDGRAIFVIENLAAYVDDGEEQQRQQASNTTVHDAAHRGWGMQESLNELGPGAREVVNELDRIGWAPLHHAAACGDIEAVNALLFAGADANIKDYRGWTPLMRSAGRNRTACMRRLLGAQARANEVNHRKETALHMAARKGHAEAMHLLLEAGASTSHRDIWDDTPLHQIVIGAQRPSQAYCIQILLSRGVNLEMRGYAGATALSRAVVQDNLPVVRCLAEAGASFSGLDDNGCGLLHHVASWSTLQMLRYLLRFGVSGIDTRLADTKSGEAAWDRFILSIYGDSHRSREARWPDPEEQAAFVELYRDIRDREIDLEMSLLQPAVQALTQHDSFYASCLLTELVEHKKRSHNHDHAGFYRGIERQVHCGEIQDALSAMEEELQHLREMRDSSPWNQESCYDHLIPSAAKESRKQQLAISGDLSDITHEPVGEARRKERETLDEGS